MSSTVLVLNNLLLPHWAPQFRLVLAIKECEIICCSVLDIILPPLLTCIHFQSNCPPYPQTFLIIAAKLYHLFCTYMSGFSNPNEGIVIYACWISSCWTSLSFYLLRSVKSLILYPNPLPFPLLSYSRIWSLAISLSKKL